MELYLCTEEKLCFAISKYYSEKLSPPFPNLFTNFWAKKTWLIYTFLRAVKA